MMCRRVPELDGFEDDYLELPIVMIQQHGFYPEAIPKILKSHCERSEAIASSCKL